MPCSHRDFPVQCLEDHSSRPSISVEPLNLRASRHCLRLCGKVCGMVAAEGSAAPMQIPKPLLSQVRAVQGDNEQLFFPH